MTRFV